MDALKVLKDNFLEITFSLAQIQTNNPESGFEFLYKDENFILIIVTLIIILLGIFLLIYFIMQKQHVRLLQVEQELRKNQERMHFSLQAAEAGTWEWDIHLNKITANERLYELLGINSSITPLNTIEDFIVLVHPFDRANIRQQINAAIEAKNIYEIVFRVIHPDGLIHYLTSRGKTYHDEEGKPILIAGITTDITSRMHSEKFLEAHFHIVQALSSASSLNEATPKILQIFVNMLEWDYAALWTLDEKIDALRLVGNWHIPDTKMSTFAENSEHHNLFLKETLPEQVLAYGQPLWIKDISKDPTYKKSFTIKEAGFHGALCFPIIEDNADIKVIELFRKAPLSDSIDTSLLNFLKTISKTISNFSQRKKAEGVHSQLTSILEFSKDGIFGYDLNGKITSWNRGAEMIFGISDIEAIGQSMEKFLPENKKNEWQGILHQIKHHHATKDMELIFSREDGQNLFLLLTSSPTINLDPFQITGGSTIVRNISLQKKAEDSLRLSEEKFRAFVETTNEWIWAINNRREITYSNPALNMILGYEPGEISGKDILTLVADEEKERFEEKLNHLLEKKKGWTEYVVKFRHKNGKYKWLESDANPITDDKGLITGFQGAFRDVTERKKLDEMKNEFISMVSHELRTPLTSIRGAIGLLSGNKSNDFSDRTKNLFEIAVANCDRLTFIINDILDIERFVAGKWDLHKKPVEIATLFNDAIKLVPQVTTVQIVIENPTDHIKVYGDYARLMQVMVNLLSNAIKFSPKNGKIFIGSKVENSILTIYVRDEGPGVPEQIQSKLFQKFSRADIPGMQIVPGAGLGLYIVKQIIEKHGGTVGFNSQPNKGATFYFNLPILNENSNFDMNQIPANVENQ